MFAQGILRPPLPHQLFIVGLISLFVRLRGLFVATRLFAIGKLRHLVLASLLLALVLPPPFLAVVLDQRLLTLVGDLRPELHSKRIGKPPECEVLLVRNLANGLHLQFEVRMGGGPRLIFLLT